jgi:hypothetical protein
MHGHSGWIRSLLLQRFTPMLAPPHAGVGRIHTDYRDATACCHGGESVAESSGGDAGDGAAQPFPAGAAPQHFAPVGPGISEIPVLHHHRCTVVSGGQVQQRGDRCPHPPIAVGRA